MQKGYCLYSKLFNLLELVGYFRRAVVVNFLTLIDFLQKY